VSGVVELLIAKNPTAGRDFELFDRLEAGIELEGAEVKSLRDHKVQLRDSFARIEEGQVWLYGMEVSPYAQAGPFAPEPKRNRRLLLHREQIKKLQEQLSRKGFTLIPTKLYFKGSLAKVELALAQGKKQWDKRETIKKRESEREISRVIKFRKGTV
jgi:SsrA-binding protein